MAAISNQQSVARSEYPQVFYVRIPDPDCKETLSQCQQVMVPVGDDNVQAALNAYDTDHNHVLDVNDIKADPASAIPAMAAARLAQIWVGTQYLSNSQHKLAGADAVVHWARASLAIDRAYATVEFLKSFNSRNIHDGFWGHEIEYNAADWEQIVKRLGVGGNGYVTDMRSAYDAIEAFTNSAKLYAHTFSHDDCRPIGGCSRVTDAWVFDPTPLPEGLRSLFTAALAKLNTINAFAMDGEVECEGWSCPSNSESARPLAGCYHGPLIAMRMNDTAKGERVFLQMASPTGWPKDLLPYLLKDVAFIPTSVSK